MSPEPNARPSQVTAAGWGIAAASAVLVVLAFDARDRLNSVDTRDALTKGLFKGLGISVDQALDLMRWAQLVSGAASVAACILGIYVLKKNKGARIALSVAAVLIVVTAPFSNAQGAGAEVFFAVFVAASTGMLWSEVARDWFAGRAPRPRVERTPPPRPLPPPAWQPPTVPTDPGHAAPPPTPGWGQPAGNGQPWAPPPAAPPAAPPPAWPATYQPAPWQQGYQPAADRPLPSQLRTACILTWVFTGVTALGYVALLLALSFDSHDLMQKVKESPSWDSSYDEHTIVVAAVVLSVLFLVWCAGAAVLAWFAWRGEIWAWVMLAVSTGLAAVVSVIAVPYSVVHLIACGVTVGLLLSGPTRQWFAERQSSARR